MMKGWNKRNSVQNSDEGRVRVTAAYIHFSSNALMSKQPLRDRVGGAACQNIESQMIGERATRLPVPNETLPARLLEPGIKVGGQDDRTKRKRNKMNAGKLIGCFYTAPQFGITPHQSVITCRHLFVCDAKGLFLEIWDWGVSFRVLRGSVSTNNNPNDVNS
jgi:hypothetical protein